MVLEEELRRVADKIGTAATAADVLGPVDDERKKRERALDKLLHPDRWTAHPPARKTAERAFARLQELLALEAKAGTPSFDITTKTRTYLVKELAFSGSVGNLYTCTYSRDGKLKEGFLKLPRSVRDNDLIKAEGDALKKIWKSGKRRNGYFPRWEESFKHRDKGTRVDRQAVVIRRLPGFVTLADVKKAYPDGLDARDLAWIWRRALAGISLLQELEIVHGSVGPEHVLIHPEAHGVMFTGFSTSVPVGERVKLLGTSRWLTAPEIISKDQVDHTTDLYMLHKTMQIMLRHDAPRQFRAFCNGVTFDRMAVRPKDARVLLGEFDELLARLYGARKFRVFPPLPGVPR